VVEVTVKKPIEGAVKAVAKKIRKVTTQETIDRLHTTVTLLEKKEAYFNKRIDREMGRAKAYIRQNNKIAARACISRKQMYTKKLEAMAKKRVNVEHVLLQVEDTVMDMEVLDATRSGAKQLTRAHKKIGGVDKIDDTIDEVREAMESATEISDALATSFNGVEMDDIEIMDEFEELVASTMQEDLLGTEVSSDPPVTTGTGTTPSTPVATGAAQLVPTTEPTAQDDFAALSAELAM